MVCYDKTIYGGIFVSLLKAASYARIQHKRKCPLSRRHILAFSFSLFK